MIERDPAAVTRRLDELIINILPPLRAKKWLNEPALGEATQLLTYAATWWPGDMVSRNFANAMFTLFTSMLAEAQYATDQEVIVDAAWRYMEAVRRFLEPRTGPSNADIVGNASR